MTSEYFIIPLNESQLCRSYCFHRMMLLVFYYKILSNWYRASSQSDF